MSSNVKDDVDRLFECFKCGVSPPQSAMRIRKRRKSKSSQETTTHKVSEASDTRSAEEYRSLKDVNQCTEKVESTTFIADKLKSRKQISPVVFYGSPHGVPPKRPVRLLRLLHEIRVDRAAQNKSNLRKDIWATFPRQDEAIKFAKSHADVRVFSYQDHLKGQRRFLVSTYEEFWQRYKSMDTKFRHHYEVIQEGLPCHLYFDLEFNKRDNTERNGDEMVDLLILVILEALLEKYSIQGNKDWVVELDSSTEEKFSRHLIIRMPKIAFKDNSHVGAFVAEICARISKAREKDKIFDILFVKKDSNSSEPSSQLFIDTAVYSRNRCFRLALSSKAGKTSLLLPTARFRCKEMCEEDMFMASLICNIDIDCEKLLVCKMDLECVKTLHFDTEVNHSVLNHRSALQNIFTTPCTSDAPATYLMGRSPFPSLDLFVESTASLGNVSGKIRSWYWFSEFGLMVYSMSRSRFCERIGREHKSNHVMYVVDLRRADYYQKCHDPDCRGYRSPLRPIPVEAIPEISALYCSEQEGNYSAPNDFDCEFVKDELENVSPSSEKSITDSCSKDSWWVEAIKVAEDVENMQKSLDLSNTVGYCDDNDDDEDESWWMAVERTLCEAESMHFK